MPPATVTPLPELARQLLTTGEVELIVGYRAGTQPGIAAPTVVRKPEDANLLIFDHTCETNLTNYLRKFRDRKVGIVVKGCDERSVIGLLQEKQLDREKIVLIAAPCPGVIDRKRIARELGTGEITSLTVENDHVLAVVGDTTHTLPLAQALFPGCQACAVHNPRFADYAIAPPMPQPKVPPFIPEVEEMEARTADQRSRAFQNEMDKCLLCFACRNLCPACYCNQCFTDSTQPRWMGKTNDPADAAFFHLTRLLHLAGRCTGCGACERGCPVGLDLKLYNDKLRKDVKEIFAFEAGLDPAAKPPLTAYRTDDRNDFIK